MPRSDHPIIPSASDVLLAQQSSRLLGRLRSRSRKPIGVQIGGQMVEIPGIVGLVLLEALSRVAEGKGVTVSSIDEELSPQDAAQLLNVSRPYAAKLFDEGAIPSRKVGTHRRALASDVLAYKEREKQARLKILDELAAEGQRLNMGY